MKHEKNIIIGGIEFEVTASIVDDEVYIESVIIVKGTDFTDFFMLHDNPTDDFNAQIENLQDEARDSRDDAHYHRHEN